jgi:hypothetical protein
MVMSSKLVKWLESSQAKHTSMHKKALSWGCHFAELGYYSDFLEVITSESNSIFMDFEDLELEIDVLRIARDIAAHEGGAEEVLNQIVKGPIDDGDVVSKSGKSYLYDHNLCVRVCVNGEHGANAANYRGYKVWKYLNNK